MKIAIPVDDNTMESNVCESFGRTPYYLIYDAATKTSTFVENSAATSAGGAGVKAAQLVVDQKVHALLTPRCGEHAAEVIKAADIKLFKTTSRSIKESIEAYLNGALPVLDEIHAGFHGHGES